MSNTRPINLFISYSHKDEDLRDELEKHLKLLQRLNIINTWHDRKIDAGSEWKQEIDNNLETADIILLLVSADFIASDYCFDIEVKRAMQRHQDKSAIVIPILLRSYDTTGADFMSLQGLPKNFKPVDTWKNQAEAFTDISKGIRKIAEKISNTQNRPLSTENDSSIKKPTIFNVPIAQNPFFTGRDKILDELHTELHNKHELAIKPSQKAKALSGLGGVGKTQMVVEYAHRYQSEYSAVLWVLADGIDLLRNSFAQLSVLLGYKLEKQDEQVLAVQSWLSEQQNWLLIFDNAETLEILTAAQDLLPANFNGHVLFTTRAQATGGLASISVDCFDNDTGAVFLLRRCKQVAMKFTMLDEIRAEVSKEDWQSAKSLVHELGGLALAIDQAGAYIEQTDCGIKGYLQRYLSDAAAMLKKRGFVQSTDHPEAAYKTFLLAMESAKSRSELAYELLLDSALLHPDGISEILYADCDPLELDEALEALKDYSLIQRVVEKQMYTVHRVIQVIIQDVCDG